MYAWIALTVSTKQVYKVVFLKSGYHFRILITIFDLGIYVLEKTVMLKFRCLVLAPLDCRVCGKVLVHVGLHVHVFAAAIWLA